MGPWYGVDIPAPLVMKTHPGGSWCSLDPGLKATTQLLELLLGWQGERNSPANETIEACETWVE